MSAAPDATQLFDSLSPYITGADNAAGNPLAAWLSGPGGTLDVLDTLVRDTPAGPGWSPVLDVTRCPTYALAWLGQFVGVRFNSLQTTDAQMRAAITSKQGFALGTPATMLAAVNPLLSGPHFAGLVERTPDPYSLTVQAYYTELLVPLAQFEAAAVAAKPGGLILGFQIFGAPVTVVPFTFTGHDAVQTWTVPAGVTSITVDATAGQGAASNFAARGGLGGRVQCTIGVTAGHVLAITVAGQGVNFGSNTTANGGDATLLVDTTTSTTLLVVGGGGGGTSISSLVVGGAGGGVVGAPGSAGVDGSTPAGGGGGGTQSAGGAGGASVNGGHAGTAGSSLTGGVGGAQGVNVASQGTGGGEGYFGGGGGGADAPNGTIGAAGGGGSSFTAAGATGVTHTQGYQAGNGYLTLSHT